MLKIRLEKTGRKHESTFRVVVTDSKNAAKSGKTLEILGSYNPRFNKPELNSDRISYWMENGAKPSDTVHNMLVNEKIIKGKKINVLPKKSPIVDEEAIKKAEEEAKAKADAEAEAKAQAEKPVEETPVEAPEQEVEKVVAEEKKEEVTEAPAETAPTEEAPAN